MTAKKLLGSSVWIIRSNQVANFFQSNDAAILLGYLCDRDSYYTAKAEEKGEKFNGWFFSEASKIQKGTVCSSHIQRKWFEVFESINLIEVKLKGVPPKKHFKINENVLNSLMDSKCQNNEHLNINRVNIQMSTGLTHISNNRISKNRVEDKSSTNTVRKKINGNSSLKNVDTTKYLKVANKLAKVIKIRHNIKTTKSTIIKWADELRKLDTINGVCIKRQKKAIKWYKTAIDSGFVIQSASSLRKKIVNVEAAMKRVDFKSKPKNDGSNLTHHGGFKLTKKYTKI